MKLIPPTNSLNFTATDLYGDQFSLNDYRGKAVILSFFRNSTCPFCLKRVFDLSVQQLHWRKKGVEVICVFTSPSEELINFHKNKFDRLRVIPDPNLNLYQQYGIEKSLSGFFKGIILRFSTMIYGFLNGAKITKNPHRTILPADFLIDPEGSIVKLHYGTNAADNIPMEHLQNFVRDMSTRKVRANSPDK